MLSLSRIVQRPLQATHLSRCLSMVTSHLDTQALNNTARHSNALRLVDAYRERGFLDAHLNPLSDGADEAQRRESRHYLDSSHYGLNDSDKIPTAGIIYGTGVEEIPISDLATHLKRIYTNHVGYEIMHLESLEEREWLKEQIESSNLERSEAERLTYYKLLLRSEAFDHFMQRKFPMIKRYGLEGAEGFAVAMDCVLRESARQGTKSAVIGMAHRGRTNILMEVLKVPPATVFSKVRGYSDLPPGAPGTSDVLSHLNQSHDLEYDGKKLHATLLPNPSHLEAINGVAMGKVRAKSDFDGEDHLCITVHGDASISGQGVVAETLNLAYLDGYTTGGGVHLIMNNQLGYTTDPHYSRSFLHASDVGKSISAPVFHVNAENPDAVAHACELAVRYRKKFKSEVFVNVIAYRRYGHNELDEPGFTQPLMYKQIRRRETFIQMYRKELESQGILSSDMTTQMLSEAKQRLEEGYELSAKGFTSASALEGKWRGFAWPDDLTKVYDTGVDFETLVEVAKASVEHRGYEIHKRLKRLFCDVRHKMVDEGKDIDFPTAEAMAVGSLLKDGYDVRFAGQDVGRGTFSQRHFEMTDQETGQRFKPFHFMDSPGHLHCVNTPLSEFACLAFEFGYAWENPHALVMWEAQFGDFFNGAQITVDTFISCGEAKWARQNGLVMNLPHGYDGAGPEHSSCRLERFLQMCDVDTVNFDADFNRKPNMNVIVPTIASNAFHALRRQMVRPFRKPLIIAGPKTLLRNPDASSPLSDFGPGTSFKPVLPEASEEVSPDNVDKLVFVSGKFYYDLVKKREKLQAHNIALVRLEELCPFPQSGVQQQLSKYKDAKTIAWCQEEPQNMGAFYFVRPFLEHCADRKISYFGRPPSAAVACSIKSLHEKEIADMLKLKEVWSKAQWLAATFRACVIVQHCGAGP